MEVTAYRMLYDNIQDFKTTARHVETEIQRHGIRHNRHDGGLRNERTHPPRHVGLDEDRLSSSISEVALESMLKLLLFLNEVAIPHDHRLVQLHERLPAKRQAQLEAAYHASRAIRPGRLRPHRFQQHGLSNVTRDLDHPTGTFRPCGVSSSTSTRMWSSGRSATRGNWSTVVVGDHYLSDISVFVSLINRVMADIQRF